MRSIIVVCVLAAVALASAGRVPFPQGPVPIPPQGCRYINGRCVEACPVGTHAYALGCGYRTPEATCNEPNPVQEKYQLCDYSSCYCDAPTVRDETTKKCVQLADCPPPSKPDQPNESGATPAPAKQPDQPNDASATATAIATAFAQN